MTKAQLLAVGSTAELERLAVESGILPVVWCKGYAASRESLTAFANAIAATVRAECAEACRAEAKRWRKEGQTDTRDFEICALLIERSNAGGNATERSEGRVDHNVGRLTPGKD